MLSDQQGSVGLSCLPYSTRRADTTFASTSAALRDPLLSSSSTSSSTLSFSASAAAIPTTSSFQLKPSQQCSSSNIAAAGSYDASNSVKPAAFNAVNVPLQRSGVEAASTPAASPLQSTTVDVTIPTVSPTCTRSHLEPVVASIPEPFVTRVRSSSHLQNSTCPPCTSSPTTTTSNSPVRPSTGHPFDYCSAADPPVRADFQIAAAPADYSAVPPSAHGAASAYRATCASEYSPPHVATTYRAVSNSCNTDAATGDYVPSLSAAAKVGPTTASASTGEPRDTRQQHQRHNQEQWQPLDQHTPRPCCQSYEGGGSVQEQQLYLPQPELQEQLSRLAPAQERHTQLQQQQHHINPSPSLQVQDHHESLPQHVLQARPQEQRRATVQSEQHGQLLHRYSQERSIEMVAPLMVVDIPEPCGETSGAVISEGKRTPHRQNSAGASCLTGSQTTVPSLSASRMSAQSYCASGSPSTHAPQLCDSNYNRETTANNYTASSAGSPAAVGAPPGTAVSTAPATHSAPGGWSSLQPPPRCFSTPGGQTLSKPTYAPVNPDAAAVSIVHDSDEAPAAVRVHSTVFSSSGACTPLRSTGVDNTTPSVTTARPLPLANGDADNEVKASSRMSSCAITRQSGESISPSENSSYLNASCRSYNSESPQNSSFARQQQWRETSISFAPGQPTFVVSPVDSAGATMQSSQSQQQLQPLVQQRQHQRRQQQRPQPQLHGQSPRQQKPFDVPQSERLLQVQQRQPQYRDQLQQQSMQPQQRFQPLQQQEPVPQRTTPPGTAPLLQQMHQQDYILQDNFPTRLQQQQLLQPPLHVQQGGQQQQRQHQQQPPQNSQHIVCHQQDVQLHAPQRRQLQQQLANHHLQHQQTGLPQHTLHTQDVNALHCVAQPQPATSALASNVSYRASPRHTSPLPLAASSTQLAVQQSVAPATYSAASSTSSCGGDSNGSDTSSQMSNSVYATPDGEVGGSFAYVQCCPQSQQQQQVQQIHPQRMQSQQQSEALQQQHQQLRGQSQDMVLTPNSCVSTAAAMSTREPQQPVRYAGHQEGRPVPQHHLGEFQDKQQYCYQSAHHQPSVAEMLSPIGTTCSQGQPHQKPMRGRPFVSPPGYAAPPGTSLSRTTCTPPCAVSPGCIIPRSSAVPIGSVRSTTFSDTSNNRGASGPVYTPLEVSSAYLSAPPSAPLLSPSSRFATISTGPTAVQTESVVAATGPTSPATYTVTHGGTAAGSSSSFQGAFVGYETSVATDLEPTLGCHAQLSPSLASGRSPAPSCYVTAAAGSAPPYTDVGQTVGPYNTNAFLCCIPNVGSSSQTDNWSSRDGSCNISSTIMKGAAKRGVTPQHKSSTRRCPQYRQPQPQPQLDTESLEAANSNSHPLRAVRGLPIQQRKLFRNLARQTPRVQGLTFDHNQIRWISYWKNSQGKQIQRHFPVSRFGFIEARRLALEERNRILGWPLDTDEAADAIAELSRTAEQSLQQLLQQSLAANNGGQQSEGPTTALTPQGGKGVAGVSERTTVTARRSELTVSVTDAHALQGLTRVKRTGPRESSGSMDGDVGQGRGSRHTRAAKLNETAVCAAGLGTREQQHRPAAASEEVTGPEYFVGTEEAYTQPVGGLIADATITISAATARTSAGGPATVHPAPSADRAQTVTSTRGAESCKENDSADPPISTDALQLCYAASEGEYSSYTYNLSDETTTEAAEKREALLQYQKQHRTSVISASTKDQEKVQDPSSQATSQTPVGPPASTSGSSAGNTGAYHTASAVSDGGKSRAASLTHLESSLVQQRDRSAASTNVEEDADAPASLLEDTVSINHHHHQDQHKWMKDPHDDQQSQQLQTAEETYITVTNNSQPELLDKSMQSQHPHQPMQQYTLQPQHQSQPGENVLHQKEWPTQRPSLQQSALQGTATEGASTSKNTGDYDALEARAAAENSDTGAGRRPQQASELEAQQNTKDLYHDPSSSAHQNTKEQQHFRSDAPPSYLMQREQQLEQLAPQQPVCAHNADVVGLSKIWQGPDQSQQQMVFAGQSPHCETPTAATQLSVASRVGGLSESGPPNVFDTASGAATNATLTPTTPMTGRWMSRNVGATVVTGTVRAHSAGPTPSRSRQQQRQRSRCRKRKLDSDFFSSRVQEGPATLSPVPRARHRVSTAVAQTRLLPGHSSERVQKRSLHAGAAAREYHESPSSVNMNLSANNSSRLITTTDALSSLADMHQVQLQSRTFDRNSSNDQPGNNGGIGEMQLSTNAHRGHGYTGEVVETQQNFTIGTPHVSYDGGLCFSTKQDRSPQIQQQSQGVLYSNQTLPWSHGSADAICVGWGSMQNHEQQQEPRVQQDIRRATQVFATAVEGPQLLQQQTEQLTTVGPPCVLQSQQRQGRSQKHQRPSSKKKSLMQDSCSVDASLCATTAKLTAAASAAASAVISVASTTVAAAAVASASLKRKKLPEHACEQKDAQGCSSRKARKKCKPEEQQHALFSAAAAAARQAVDTLPEPPLHPHLLQRPFPESMLQYVQSSLQQQQQLLQTQQAQWTQQKRVEQRQQGKPQDVQTHAGTMEVGGGMPTPHTAALQELKQEQQQVAQHQRYSTQQQQQGSERQSNRPSAVPFRPTSNDCRYLLPTPPQTPSCAAPFEYTVESSRSNSYSRDNSSSSCCCNSTRVDSRCQPSSSTMTSGNSNSNSTCADSSNVINHLVRSSGTSGSSAHSIVNSSSISSVGINNDGHFERENSQISKSHQNQSSVDNGELLSRKPVPLCSSCWSPQSNAECSSCNNGTSSNCSSDTRYDAAAAVEGALTDEHSGVRTECALSSDPATESLFAFQNTAVIDLPANEAKAATRTIEARAPSSEGLTAAVLETVIPATATLPATADDTMARTDTVPRHDGDEMASQSNCSYNSEDSMQGDTSVLRSNENKSSVENHALGSPQHCCAGTVTTELIGGVSKSAITVAEAAGKQSGDRENVQQEASYQKQEEGQQWPQPTKSHHIHDKAVSTATEQHVQQQTVLASQSLFDNKDLKQTSRSEGPCRGQQSITTETPLLETLSVIREGSRERDTTTDPRSREETQEVPRPCFTQDCTTSNTSQHPVCSLDEVSVMLREASGSCGGYIGPTECTSSTTHCVRSTCCNANCSAGEDREWSNSAGPLCSSKETRSICGYNAGPSKSDLAKDRSLVAVSSYLPVDIKCSANSKCVSTDSSSMPASDFPSESSWPGGGVASTWCSAKFISSASSCSFGRQQVELQMPPVKLHESDSAQIDDRPGAISCISEAQEVAGQQAVETVWTNSPQRSSCKDNHACDRAFDRFSSCAEHRLIATGTYVSTPCFIDGSSVCPDVLQHTRQQKNPQALPQPEQCSSGGDGEHHGPLLGCSTMKEPQNVEAVDEKAGEKEQQVLGPRRSICSGGNDIFAEAKEPRGEMTVSEKMQQSFRSVHDDQEKMHGHTNPCYERRRVQLQEHHLQTQQEYDVHPHITPSQHFFQHVEDTGTSPPFEKYAQATEGRQNSSSSLLINSSLLSCASSAKLNPYATDDSTETPLSPFAVHPPPSPGTGRRRSSRCSTAKRLRAASKSCSDELHKDKGQQQHQLTSHRTPGAIAVVGSAALSAALSPASSSSSSAAADPDRQGYLHAPGDFFQLLPSPRRPSSDWLALENNHNFPILQPPCGRTSLISHATTNGAAASLTSPSSTRRCTTSTGAAVATHASVASSMTATATITTARAAAARAATAPPHSSSETTERSIPTTTPATTTAGDGESSLIGSLAAASSSEQQQPSVSASCSLVLLGARGYLAPTGQDLTSVSAAVQHHQQLSPLWTVTVPLPALFRSSTSSSSVESFSPLPLAATGGRRGAVTSVGGPTNAAAVEGIDAVSEPGSEVSSSDSSRLCAPSSRGQKVSDTQEALSRARAAGVVKQSNDTVTDDSKEASEQFWRKLLPTENSKDATVTDVDADDSYDGHLITTGPTAVDNGGTATQRDCTSQSLSAGVRLSACAGLHRPSGQLRSSSLLRICTPAPEAAMLSPHERDTATSSTTHGCGTGAALFPAGATKYTLTDQAETQSAAPEGSNIGMMMDAAEIRGHPEQNLLCQRENYTVHAFKREGFERRTEERGPRSNHAVDCHTWSTAHGTGFLSGTAEATAAPGVIMAAGPASTPVSAPAEEVHLLPQVEVEGRGDQITTGLRKEVRSPLHVASGVALWRSTTATSDGAAHGAEEESSFFGRNTSNSWLVRDKLGCLALSVNEDNDSSSGSNEHDGVQASAASGGATASAPELSVHDSSAYNGQSASSLSNVITPAASATERENLTGESGCPVTVVADSGVPCSTTATVSVSKPHNVCFTPKQALLSTPIFHAREGSTEELPQRRDHPLPSTAGATGPWTAAAASSWTAATAGEEGWSPLLSFAAVPPSPIDAPGRLLRLSSPRFSALAPLPATAVTTCSSSSTEADAGAPFSFLLSERALSTLSGNQGATATTGEKVPQHQLSTDS